MRPSAVRCDNNNRSPAPPATGYLAWVDGDCLPVRAEVRANRRSGLKPDVTAPGVGVVSNSVEGSQLADSRPAADRRYVALAGTSMADAPRDGAASLPAGETPGLKGDRAEGLARPKSAKIRKS